MNDLIGKSLGRYHILEQLGEGGMATVYKAYDTRLEADVAVKVIRTENILPSVLERSLKRFEREAKALARLTHPNIVKVTDYGEYEGKPYLVMPYFPGGTLKEKLGKPIPWQEAIQILLPIAEALDYAHSHNMIHRDVKPSNILLAERGQPMLSDFGIAKILDLEDTQDLTGTSAAIGTPEYMAPEQATAKTVDHRADIYSLGIVLYEMVTGRRPFTADTPMAVLIKHAHDPLPSPKQFVPNLPDSVDKMLFKALAKQPDNRYQTMDEFTTALKGLLAGTHANKLASVPKPKQQVRRETTIIEGTTREVPTSVDVPRRASVRLPWIWIGLVVVCVLGLVGIVWIGGKLSTAIFTTSTPSRTPTPAFTLTPTFLLPSDTLFPSQTPTESFTLTPTSLPTEITDAKGVQMVFVPSGEFKMGSNDPNYGSGDNPPHKVYLDDFYIDRNEVTNSEFSEFLNAIQSQTTITSTSVQLQGDEIYAIYCESCGTKAGRINWNNSKFSVASKYVNHPVAHVTWYAADAFCKWREARLLTEAEWEKAARGTDERYWPSEEGLSRWPDCPYANFLGCNGGTTVVGTHQLGQSPYGVNDMSGNVLEWVADWYNSDILANSSSVNPLGSSSGVYRVLRGGSWNTSWMALTVFYRFHRLPEMTSDEIGFRCARGVNP